MVWMLCGEWTCKGGKMGCLCREGMLLCTKVWRITTIIYNTNTLHTWEHLNGGGWINSWCCKLNLNERMWQKGKRRETRGKQTMRKCGRLPLPQLPVIMEHNHTYLHPWSLIARPPRGACFKQRWRNGASTRSVDINKDTSKMHISPFADLRPRFRPRKISGRSLAGFFSGSNASISSVPNAAGEPASCAQGSLCVIEGTKCRSPLAGVLVNIQWWMEGGWMGRVWCMGRKASERKLYLWLRTGIAAWPQKSRTPPFKSRLMPSRMRQINSLKVWQ